MDPGETDPNNGVDCPVMPPAARLRLVADLVAPLNLAYEVFDTMPCTADPDFRICDEAPGVHDAIDDPALPFMLAGVGGLIFIEYDSELSAPGTVDVIDVRKDPIVPGALIVELR